MVCKRIIPCLDVKNGRTVKGVHFEDLIDAGDPVSLAKYYSDIGADELVLLDISATVEGRKTQIDMVNEVSSTIRIPFTVGGGINDVQGAYDILQAGADKIAINSSAIGRPQLVSELAQSFGNQCVVVAIDAKFENKNWVVYSKGGTSCTSRNALTWALEAQERGAGEILMTSMSHDGTKRGFAIDLLSQLDNVLNIPIIASGGAGTMQHFLDVFNEGRVSAALAASIFHFGDIGIVNLKKFLHENGVHVRI